MDFNFSDFAEMEFPRHKEIVYILYFSDESGPKVPFYVGESSRGIGRFGDYISAKFSAPTDFKVGEAVRYLRGQGFKVLIKYKEYEDRKGEERKIISILRGKSRLLNELTGFNYKASNEEAERERLHSFLNIVVQEKGIRTKAISAVPSREETKTGLAFLTEEVHGDQIEKSVSSWAGKTNQIIIEGRVTTQNIYKTDNKDICELYINKDSAHALPHECGRKEPIPLAIGEITYEAGVHETKEGVVWVSSVLKKRAGREEEEEKARLVDVLEEIGLKKGDRVILKKNADGIFVLSGSAQP